jgi:hypothetical protein
VVRTKDMRNTYKILVGKRKSKRSLGRPRCRWVDNITVDTKEIVFEDVERIQLPQYCVHLRAVVNKVIYFRVP